MNPVFIDNTLGNESNSRNTDRREDLHGFDESALIANAQNGNHEAFEALVKLHSNKLLRAIRRITRTREDAEDALQDALLKAFAHVRTFDGRSQFSTWLTRIAINSALMIVRTNRYKLESRMESYEDNGASGLKASPDPSPTPEAAYIQQERRAHLRQAIGALAPTIRQALTLQKVHGLSVTETAEKIGISISATKSRLVRARVDLRRALAESYL